jgi:hypothetical protein
LPLGELVSLHNAYLIALSALFALTFAIMILSLEKHRRAAGDAAQFSGPRGGVQCLWAMVPIAILGGVDLALIETPQHPIAAPRVALAATLPPSLSGLANEAWTSDAERLRQWVLAAPRAQAIQ